MALRRDDIWEKQKTRVSDLENSQGQDVEGREIPGNGAKNSQKLGGKLVKKKK